MLPASPSLVEEVADQPGGGGLPVGAGDTDQREPPARVAVPGGAEHQRGAPAVADHDLGHARLLRRSRPRRRRPRARPRRRRSGGRRPGIRAPRRTPCPGSTAAAVHARCPSASGPRRVPRSADRRAEARRASSRQVSVMGRPAPCHWAHTVTELPGAGPLSPPAGAVRTTSAESLQADPEPPPMERQGGLAHRTDPRPRDRQARRGASPPGGTAGRPPRRERDRPAAGVRVRAPRSGTRVVLGEAAAVDRHPARSQGLLQHRPGDRRRGEAAVVLALAGCRS